MNTQSICGTASLRLELGGPLEGYRGYPRSFEAMERFRDTRLTARKPKSNGRETTYAN